MTPEQEAHLQRVKDWICDLIDKKYRAGQKEHGGDLWKKPGLFGMIIEEIVDLAVYVETQQEQIDNPSIVNPNLKDN
jgi:hypothetical protein